MKNEHEKMARVVGSAHAEAERATASENEAIPASVSPDQKNVYALIAAVSGELARVGIAKARTNSSQQYSFRGIDDVYNVLAPLLAKHRLVVVPRILTRDCVERTTAKGGVLFYTTVAAEFDFVSAWDGSTHTARTFGEAMDSGDKSTNKAMSAAYKYAAFQTFCIPTEGDNDTENQTHEVASDDAYVDWLADMGAVADDGYQALVTAIRGSGEAFQARLRADGKTWAALKAKAEKAAAVPA